MFSSLSHPSSEEPRFSRKSIAAVVAITSLAGACVRPVGQPSMTTNARPPVDRLIEWPGDSTETAQSASISPDGRLVSYVALGPGDLHVREVESGCDVAVTRFEANGGFVDYLSLIHI